MKTKKPYWNFTPQQAVLIKLGDPVALETFIKEHKCKILKLIREYLNKIPDELMDEEDYFQELCMRIQQFGFSDEGKYITDDIKQNLIYIRNYKPDYYFKPQSLWAGEGGDEFLITDFLGYSTPFIDSCSKIFLDLYGIQAIKIYNFCEKFLRVEIQKKVLLLHLEGYTYSNIMLKLDLKSNRLGDVYKSIKNNLLKHYEEIKKFLFSEYGINCDIYDTVYLETKKEMEEFRARKRAEHERWLEKNLDRYRKIKSESDRKYRENNREKVRESWRKSDKKRREKQKALKNAC